jgi:hypothetical protein
LNYAKLIPESPVSLWASALPVPPITIEQYLTFESPEGFRDELINGRIVMSPEPKMLHFDVADNLYKLLTKAGG